MQQQQWFPEAVTTRARGMLMAMTPIQFFSTAAVAFLFATFLFVFSILRLLRRPRSKTILLTGLTGSGKTVIFYMLRDGSSHGGTLTSMDVNNETFVAKERRGDPRAEAIRFVDVPGHSGLRSKLDGYLAVASGIVFVVDALDFLSNCAVVAEYLHNDILSKAAVSKRRKVPVLVLCNKTDKVTAHSKEFIARQLEKEIEKLRASRTGASSVDAVDEVPVGIPGRPFSFAHCRNPITIAEASALTGELSHLYRFIVDQVQ